jgi:hypothetical protein
VSATIVAAPLRPGGSAIEGSTPARLYATVVGATLTIAGIVGFFYSADFGSPGRVEDALGAFAVNGWQSALHLVTGLLGLVAAGRLLRAYALGTGLLYLVLAIWGFAAGSGGTVAGMLPVNGADDLVNLVIGVAGLVAGVAGREPAAPPSRASA